MQHEWFLAVTSACQPSSTTIVWFGSMTSAGPAMRWPGCKRFAQQDARIVPGAVGKEARLARGLGQGVFRERRFRLREFRAAADRLDRDRFHHEFFRLVDKSETGAVRRLEGGLHGVERHRFRAAAARSLDHVGGDFECGVGAGIADMRAHMHADVAARDTLTCHFFRRFLDEDPADFRDRRARGFPNDSSIACVRVARMSASPMP